MDSVKGGILISGVAGTMDCVLRGHPHFRSGLDHGQCSDYRGVLISLITFTRGTPTLTHLPLSESTPQCCLCMRQLDIVQVSFCDHR